MAGWFDIDWARIFIPTTPLLETFLRGTLTYLTLFTLLRLVLKRESGMIGITNLLVVVLLADAVQNGLTDDYHSITDGFLLVLTILLWSHLLDWLGYRYPLFQRFIHPSPLPLVSNGQLLRRNMRQELITRDELLEYCRQQGVDDLSKVKAAYIEGSGHISIITHDDVPQKPTPPRTLA